jgi:tetratricopeptide (TPR) repeat protein
MSTIPPEPEDAQLDAAVVRDCLRSVLESTEFQGSHRMQEFLTYVVEEKLAGRETRIKGKTIAEDVYGRKVDGNSDNETVVRVDAGRLRRKLDWYYKEVGQKDAVIIRIQPGSYVPVFAAQSGRQKNSENFVILVGLPLLIFVGVVGFFWAQQNQPPVFPSKAVETAAPSLLEIQRQTMFDKSPASLQAFNIAQQARELIFPPIDPVRLKSTLEMFQHAITLDGNYTGGYAGAAQVLAFFAYVPGPGNAEEALAKATELARHAQRLNPTDAWVQSALAWVSFVAGDFNRAKELSARAAALDPHDKHVRDFHGMIAIFGGDFERAAAVVKPHLPARGEKARLVHQNIYALAQFHLGNFDETINFINKITVRGGASSPLTTAYLAAAYQANGDEGKARDLVKKMKSAWPRFQIDKLLNRAYQHRQHAETVLGALRQAGWSAEK